MQGQRYQNSSTEKYLIERENHSFMGKCFNCGKVGYWKWKCKNETAKKLQEREDRNDDKDFGLMTYNDLRKEKKQVKSIDTPEIIPEQGQLCTIDGCQYHTFNRSSWIGDTSA